jgi:hypothetical protein
MIKLRGTPTVRSVVAVGAVLAWLGPAGEGR